MTRLPLTGAVKTRQGAHRANTLKTNVNLSQTDPFRMRNICPARRIHTPAHTGAA